jgi:hypothetical protein
MDFYFIGLLLFLVSIIFYILSRLLRINQPHISEPVTQSEYEKQYLSLMEDIESLEEALEKRAGSKRLQMKLEVKRQQAKYLQTLMTPAVLSDVPDIYQTDEEFTQMQSWMNWRSSHLAPYLCPKCKMAIQSGDKFCASCGQPLQENKGA